MRNREETAFPLNANALAPDTTSTLGLSSLLVQWMVSEIR